MNENDREYSDDEKEEKNKHRKNSKHHHKKDVDLDLLEAYKAMNDDIDKK